MQVYCIAYMGPLRILSEPLSFWLFSSVQKRFVEAIIKWNSIGFLVLTCFVLAGWTQAHSQKGPQTIPITTFEAPGAGNGPGQGTIGIAITPSSAITGDYIDAGNVAHGFLRSPDGIITSFDVTGAGTSAGEGTQPWSINPSGQITGWFIDAGGLTHGFVRSSDGAITTFDAPGAGKPVGVPCTPPVICSNGTQPASINSAGTIAGQYVGTNGVFHGFLRTPDGSITTFDHPGAGTGPGQGTFVTFDDGINSAEEIAGGYIDANGMPHAFVRAKVGAFATFDVPGSVFTDNSGINPAGTVASFYIDLSNVMHGYVRAKDGTFTLFDVEGAGTGSSQGTETEGLNTPGDVVGNYIDTSGVNHGFLRAKSGAITKFDAPGAGTSSGQGTIPYLNNPANVIVGFYIDANGVYHGFLRE